MASFKAVLAVVCVCACGIQASSLAANQFASTFRDCPSRIPITALPQAFFTTFASANISVKEKAF
jgi:hypothetical protein